MNVFLISGKMFPEFKGLYDKVGQVFRNVRSHIVFLEDGSDLLACDKFGIRNSITVP